MHKLTTILFNTIIVYLNTFIFPLSLQILIVLNGIYPIIVLTPTHNDL